MVQAIADSLQIHYEDLGRGEPALLLLPAWCQSHAVYGSLPEKCAAYRRVLALDWRGTGQSDIPTEEYGTQELVEDALSVIEASSVQQVVPVSVSHGGRVAIELRRKLGERIPKLVLLDWLLLPPPPPYMDLVKALAEPDQWQHARDTLFGIWLEGVENPDVIEFVQQEMGSYSAEMWMRSGREIAAGYAKESDPLKALTALNPHVPVLHVYSQPPDLEYLSAQKSYAQDNPWFKVHKLKAKSHFPTFELPDEIATAIEKFMA
ncbi:alpha/beta hydrolase [Pleurocapsales cyanobacterium LEGE 06147]|nr:alpha/beta hydrolase [Pleurocapsales cyanobacterium LEGE 06147]